MIQNLFHNCAYSYSHGIDKKCLGIVPLYYSLAYTNKCKICVVLGSGGGIVPMAFRMAQKDLNLIDAETWIVDGFLGDEYGNPLEPGGWAHKDSVMNTNFPEIKTIKDLTENSGKYFDIIDLLHIDAEHTYEAARQDFETFKNNLIETSIIIFHDTQDSGVQKAVDEVVDTYNYDVLNLADFASGLSILRKPTRNDYKKNLYDDCKTRPTGHKWTLGPDGGKKTWGSGH